MANMNIIEDVAALSLKIKEENYDIIDLDLDKSPEDLVYEWNSKIHKKFTSCVVDDEQNLNGLMKWYIRLMKDEAANLEDYQTLKTYIIHHIQFFKLYVVELNCYFVDNYLDDMEEILLFFVNLEVKSIPANQRNGKRTSKKFLTTTCRKIISLLHIYLMNREERIWHVVMKVKLNIRSEESRSLMNLIYGNFLMQKPKHKSDDLEFCRAYILHQKWKMIRKPEEWEKMDEVMCNLQERTLESIQANRILKQILLPQNTSILDTLTHISENHVIITEEYFKYLKSLKVQKNNPSPEINDVEREEEVMLTSGDDGDVSRKALLDYLKSMASAQKENEDKLIEVKLENISKDDCQIVGVTKKCLNHQIGDEIEFLYMSEDVEQDTLKTRKTVQKKKEEKKNSQSFLKSIAIPAGGGVSMDTVSSCSTNTVSHLTDSAPSVVSTCIILDTNPNTSTRKNVVSAETQTDDIDGTCGDNSDRTNICGNYYYYGLVTPPSDQHRDERGISVAESPKYPDNVYTNIAMVASPNECDSLAAHKFDSLTPSEDIADASASIQSVFEPSTTVCSKSSDLNEQVPELLNEFNGNLNEMFNSEPTEHATTQTNDSTKSQNYNILANVVSTTLTDSNDNGSFNENNNEEGCFANSEATLEVLESCTVIVDGVRSSPVELEMPNPSSSTSCSTSRSISRIPSPFKSKDGGAPETSTGIEYVLPDTSVTSQTTSLGLNKVFIEQIGHIEISIISPDVTSTSTDIHDCSAGLIEGDRIIFEEDQEHPSMSTEETEDANSQVFRLDDLVTFPNKKQYTEFNRDQDFDSNAMITQSDMGGGENEEFFIGEPVLMIDASELSNQNSVSKFVNEEVQHENNSYTTEVTVDRELPLENVKIKKKKRNLDPCEDQTRRKYEEIAKEMDFDEILSAPVSRMNGGSKYIACSKPFQETKSYTVPTYNRLGLDEMMFSDYEQTVDLRTSYEPNNSNSVTIPNTPNKLLVEDYCASANLDLSKKDHSHQISKNSSADLLFTKTWGSLQDVGQSKPLSLIGRAASDKIGAKNRNKKRVQVTDATLDSRNSVPQFPTEVTGLKSILKKPLPENNKNEHRASTRRISKHVKNSKPLDQYNTKLYNDIFRRKPSVWLQRLSESAITGWLRKSDIAKKVRLENEQISCSNSLMLRVDYDKETFNNDKIQYLTSNIRTSNINHQGQDHVTGFQDMSYTEKKTGKRKRQSNISLYNTRTAKKESVSRKSLDDNNMASVPVRKTPRKRRKPEKDYDA